MKKKSTCLHLFLVLLLQHAAVEVLLSADDGRVREVKAALAHATVRAPTKAHPCYGLALE